MKKFASACILLFLSIAAIRAQTGPSGPAPPPNTTITVNAAPADRVASGPAKTGGPAAPLYGFYWAYGAMTIVLAISLIAMLLKLRGWSLKEALSDDSAVGGPKPSISRLIALTGFVVIISIYLGVGYSVVFRLLSGGDVVDLSGLGTFLLGAAALFTPYLANQIKSAVVGASNAQTTAAANSTVTAISPNVVPGGAAQTITVLGTGLDTAQTAICTLENGSESPISADKINVQNSGAVQVAVTMPGPSRPGNPYDSNLTLVTNAGQRIPAMKFKVT